MVTNYIKGASYKEIYDLHTDSESNSILTIHTPITNLPRQMLGGFFKQYRRFKYRGALVSLRPAARLPADPEQISYDPGDTGIDPRDMLNPILARGYCGDSLGTFLNTFMAPGTQAVKHSPSVGDPAEEHLSGGFTGSSVDDTSFASNLVSGDLRAEYLERLYYQSLSDPGFKKIPMQKSYRRFVHPLTYELATTVQYLAKPQTYGIVQKASTGLTSALKDASKREDPSYGLGQGADAWTREDNYLEDQIRLKPRVAVAANNSVNSNSYFAQRITQPVLTSNKRPLGWLDTDTVVSAPTVVQDSQVRTWGTGYADYAPVEGVAESIYGPYYSETVLPLVNMMVLCFPKAYKQEMFYRLSITHVFDFKDYRPLKGLVSPFDGSAIVGGSLEWCDWDDSTLVTAGPSVTSTAANFELVDVLGDGPTAEAS